MNEKWRRESIIRKKEIKLTDVVHGLLTEEKKERMNWHFDHPTPYYLSNAKENPYGTKKQPK